MKRDGVDKMFPFSKQGISEWCSKYEAKICSMYKYIYFGIFWRLK